MNRECSTNHLFTAHRHCVYMYKTCMCTYTHVYTGIDTHACVHIHMYIYAGIVYTDSEAKNNYVHLQTSGLPGI